MRIDVAAKSQAYLRFQRNAFAGLSFILASAVTVQGAYLFSKKERVIVTPPNVDRAFWVESNQVSPSYLEQYGVYIGELLLSKSDRSAARQRDLLLQQVSPGFSSLLRQKLLDEETLLKKQSAAYVFYTSDIIVNPRSLKASLKGDRVFYSSGKEISKQEETYTLSFEYRAGKLLLSGFQREGSCDA